MLVTQSCDNSSKFTDLTSPLSPASVSGGKEDVALGVGGADLEVAGIGGDLPDRGDELGVERGED